MRALTLTQPWCGLVASGIKLIENRDRSIIRREDFGKPFALHAGLKIDMDVYARISEIAPDVDFKSWDPTGRITGAVIGVATVARAVVQVGDAIVDYHTDEVVDLGGQRRWFFGRIGYVLRDVRLLTPVDDGRQGFHRGFWHLPAELERAVMAQIGGGNG